MWVVRVYTRAATIKNVHFSWLHLPMVTRQERLCSVLVHAIGLAQRSSISDRLDIAAWRYRY